MRQIPTGELEAIAEEAEKLASDARHELRLRYRRRPARGKRHGETVEGV